MKKLIKRWLGISDLERRVKQHNNDILIVMDRQIEMARQYPLYDQTVVPTEKQVEDINKGGKRG